MARPTSPLLRVIPIALFCLTLTGAAETSLLANGPKPLQIAPSWLGFEICL
jgi:hypothetical protein